MKNLTACAAASVALAGFTATAVAHANVSTPPQTGCPAGYQVLQLGIDVTAEQGYHAPFVLDAAGNNNGIVCGLPLPEAACVAQDKGPCPVPVFYNFVDDTITKK
jgi:hypothetical protein